MHTSRSGALRLIWIKFSLANPLINEAIAGSTDHPSPKPNLRPNTNLNSDVKYSVVCRDPLNYTPGFDLNHEIFFRTFEFFIVPKK